MAEPKVFVSSTCYDLRYIRENLKYFIKSLGYDAILSEEGSVFFNPRLHVQDACIAELPNCQMLVLIIGGRFGSSFKGTTKSVTNAEYSEAVRLQIPIFALVEQGVLSDLSVYVSNRSDQRLVDKMKFPSVDNVAVFDFIEEVRSNAVNNALVPFRDFADIESYLKQQWAAMMFSFLAGANQNARVADTLSVMQEMSERIEMLSRQILNSVGTDQAKVTAALYDAMLSHDATKTVQDWGWSITPFAVLRNATLSKCAKALGQVLNVRDRDGLEKLLNGGRNKELKLITFQPMSNAVPNCCVTHDGKVDIDARLMEALSKDYSRMRKDFQRVLKRSGITAKEFLASEPTVSAEPPNRRRPSHLNQQI